MAVEFEVTGYSTTGTGDYHPGGETASLAADALSGSGHAAIQILPGFARPGQPGAAVPTRLCGDGLLILAGDALFESYGDVAPDLDS